MYNQIRQGKQLSDVDGNLNLKGGYSVEFC